MIKESLVHLKDKLSHVAHGALSNLHLEAPLHNMSLEK